MNKQLLWYLFKDFLRVFEEEMANIDYFSLGLRSISLNNN